ncbi:lysozyme inhibitor LprI family protein [Tropicimonas sp. IMCC6043]|uniref:lysozyme inhibitor LprI family protein n=1 Tax=Tropicimonas sp. IMCC6043 TaxID=2510645 RepID=UPI00101C4A34|nr:lysozyme inhibitor LprI family protein [Tropicimonas sp. IMCC6043]RYH10376.1 DUF1311 domain-containing protein [Tropicimonas sp. IMCC6043]
MHLPLTIALALLTASAAAAQEGPSFDCTKAGSSTETLICSDDGLAALDRRVAGRYAAARAAAGDGAAADELRAVQRGWIKGRDACWQATDLRDCVEASYLRREAELVTQWMLEAPTGTAVWTCGDTPPEKVVTVFFDTTLPSLRFESGESVDSGTLVRTASGAKYEGSFGRSIWMKGDTARYRGPDPDGTEVTCVLASEE